MAIRCRPDIRSYEEVKLKQPLLKHGNTLLITIHPVFAYVDNNEDSSDSFEWNFLPKAVKKEVLEYFQSGDFINNISHEYALNDPGYQRWYPWSITVTIEDINFLTSNKGELYIELTCSVTIVYEEYRDPDDPGGILTNDNGKYFCKPTNKKYTGISLEDFTEAVKDGYWKSSHSGNLATYGRYLDETPGKYRILLEPENIKVEII
jgi:hypothetical protein